MTFPDLSKVFVTVFNKSTAVPVRSMLKRQMNEKRCWYVVSQARLQ